MSTERSGNIHHISWFPFNVIFFRCRNYRVLKVITVYVAPWELKAETQANIPLWILFWSEAFTKSGKIYQWLLNFTRIWLILPAYGYFYQHMVNFTSIWLILPVYGLFTSKWLILLQHWFKWQRLCGVDNDPWSYLPGYG